MLQENKEHKKKNHDIETYATGRTANNGKKRDQETKSRQEQDYRIRQATRKVSSKYEAWHHATIKT